MAKSENAKRKLEQAKLAQREEEQLEYIKSGYSYLREAVEAYYIAKVLKDTVRPFDRAIRAGNIKDIYIDEKILNYLSEKHSRLSVFDLGHWGPEGHMTIASPERLEEEIIDFDNEVKDYELRAKQASVQ